jgi:hypothetical protein
MNITKNFVGSKMNKALDERLVPAGEYRDALNIRISSDEDGQAGSAENSKGNELLAALEYDGSPLANSATCIGAYEDGEQETIYWFVTDQVNSVDMIVSYNTNTEVLRYHVVSTSVLNFSPTARITGVDLIDNLLFFTDNRNAPRRINVDTTYPAPVDGLDQITEDDISVIVKPPLAAPTITLVKNSTDENYMEDKYISFAYRYRYINGEYSATSPFSAEAFTPGAFRLDYGSLDNLGMLNTINQATISFNTGPANVTDVEVLFKESNVNIIKVVEKFNKADKGWGDNTTQSLDFDNRKIYTTLTEAELLRLYDNVPLKAKAQTTIGNRIMYGNYVDGYDIDEVMDYTLSLESQDISVGTITVGKENHTYSVDGSVVITDARATLDLSDVPLTSGTTIYLTLSLEHSQFSGDASYPALTENEFIVTDFPITLTSDYASVSEFYNSNDFQVSLKGVGHPRNPADCADGYSLSDQFNCSIAPDTGWTFTASTGFSTGVDGDVVKIIAPVATYEDDANPGTYAYEYFYTLAVSARYRQITQAGSLHSDRDYEVGLVYMDDYGRSSTVQVCNTNNIYVPKSASDKQNKIRLTIGNQAPSWATKYKPVIKPSYGDYETIAIETYFQNIKTGTWFLKLIGDNIQKVQEGDIIICKRDSAGVNYKQPKVKVLSLGVKEEGFIDPNDESGQVEPSGVYMEVRPTNFSVNPSDSLIWYGNLVISTDASEIGQFSVERAGLTTDTTDTVVSYWKSRPVSAGSGPRMSYPTYINTGVASPLDDRVYGEYEIPRGSEVNFEILYRRSGPDTFRWEFYRTYYASNDYDNMYDFIIGENVDFTDPTNDPDADSQTNTPEAFWDDTIGTSSLHSIPINPQINALYFRYMRYVNSTDFTTPKTESFLSVATQGGYLRPDEAELSMNIEVRSASGALIFETEATETDGITYYENEQVFDIVSGEHQGNITNQSGSTDAVVELDFFNCYTFGNGVESYKIRDSLAGVPLKVGSRAHAVSEQEYKQAHRYADITYSGVYSEESNINKLNQFNLGLVNYKTLEKNYGPIEIMHSRLNDILVLQEDRISYVLANGKNLFSDASGGGAILSTPDVLGQQVPRPEQYGISNNPESFAAYGPYVFFTDSKRNAVISLTGGNTSEKLDVISNRGMRSWFRDMFKDNAGYIKLGGFDPYSNEYILTSLGSTNYTLSYSPGVEGWPSFYSYIPEMMIGMNSYFYSFDKGSLYRHNTNNTRNNFYGTQYTSKITGFINDDPSTIKTFKTMVLESDGRWDCTVETDMGTGFIDKTWFVLKEGDYFSHIRRTDSELEARSVQGLGTITGVNATDPAAVVVTFPFNLDSMVSVGDTVRRSGTGVPVIGTITGKTRNTLTIDTTSGSTPSVGMFLLYTRDVTAESYGTTGYYLQYTIENSQNSAVEIFAVGAGLFKSYP